MSMKNQDNFGLTVTPLIKKLKKKTIKHNLGYRPIMELYCKRIKGNNPFPRWDFHDGYITPYSFYFYHEPYSKKEFEFHYRIYKATDPVFVEEKIIK